MEKLYKYEVFFERTYTIIGSVEVEAPNMETAKLNVNVYQEWRDAAFEGLDVPDALEIAKDRIVLVDRLDRPKKK